MLDLCQVWYWGLAPGLDSLGEGLVWYPRLQSIYLKSRDSLEDSEGGYGVMMEAWVGELKAEVLIPFEKAVRSSACCLHCPGLLWYGIPALGR